MVFIRFDLDGLLWPHQQLHQGWSRSKRGSANWLFILRHWTVSAKAVCF